jgi:hypothetical protein
MPEPLTMETLAEAITKQGEALTALTAVTQKHLVDCDLRQRRYNKLQTATARQLKNVTDAVESLDKKLEPFEQAAHVANFLARWGKVMVGTVIVAFIGSITTIVSQQYLDHQAVAHKADVAVQAATAADKTTNQILQRVKTITPGP